MENNEQLNQNSPVSEGMENETTSKAPKKAIDGNEKKKIVKVVKEKLIN